MWRTQRRGKIRNFGALFNYKKIHSNSSDNGGAGDIDDSDKAVTLYSHGAQSSVRNLRTHLVCAVFSLLLLFFLFWVFFRWFFAVYVFFIVYCLFSSGWSRNDDGRFTKEFKRNNIACSANERRKVKVNNVMSIILSGVFFSIVRFSECSSNANENNNRRRDGKTLSWMNKRREWRRPTKNLQWQSGIVCSIHRHRCRRHRRCRCRAHRHLCTSCSSVESNKIRFLLQHPMADEIMGYIIIY